MTEAARSGLVYLYAVAPAGVDAAVCEADAGIDDGQVRALVEGDVAAVVGDVPAVEFDEAPLNARLSDLDWLAPRAAAHQRVNAQLFDRLDALLPLSFGTVFRTEESVRRMLRDRRDDLAGRLQAVRGRSEWVVTLRRDTPRAEAALDAQDASLVRLKRDLAASTPGRRYLLERQVGDVRRRALRATDAAAAREVEAAVEGAAARIYREPVVAAAAETGKAMARLSALVERRTESRFCDALDQLDARWQSHGYSIERTGPWPPYRFGGVPTPHGAAGGDDGAPRGPDAPEPAP